MAPRGGIEPPKRGFSGVPGCIVFFGLFPSFFLRFRMLVESIKAGPKDIIVWDRIAAALIGQDVSAKVARAAVHKGSRTALPVRVRSDMLGRTSSTPKL